PDCIYFKDTQSRFVAFSKAFERLFKLSDTGELRGKTDFDFFTEEHARPAYEDEQEIIRSQKPIIGKLEQETHQDGRVTWALTTKMPWMAQDGSIIGTFGISKDVTAIKEAEAELDYERELFRVLLDNFPDSIYFKDLQSRFVRVSRSKAEMTLDLLRAKALAEQSGDGPKELPPHLANVEAFTKHLTGKTDFETYQQEFASAAFEDEQQIIQTRQPIIGKLEHSESGKWFLVTKMPWINKDGDVTGTFGVSRDITALKETESKLEAAHRRLIETSRLAGMAEVATDVLHNVGNVLNSVNVSCSLTLDRIRSSKVSSLSKVSALLMEHRERLAEFVSQDPRGRQIPEFLTALADHLGTEQIALVDELQQLVKHIDHIKQIVAMQQTYAKVVGVLEPVNPLQLVEDALQINAAALLRHEVKLQRHFHEETLQILTDKHKVLQILVNLIRNAKYAMDDGPAVEKLLTVKVDNDEKDQVVIQVIDNGVGIPKENLTRIFSHGFTTRRNGHGFGLHSSALAVRELGGSIQATSDGLGAGATFTLILPKEPPHQSPETA
ncbi:MAG TPA: PAS domain-containing protein, partial [Verrucomicrobiae bacterium]|nr:PAS domain-containing protein [Verrucomicrobiae bacterium]